ncbi:hypothetical protein D3C84_837620 [compost metagenome]
MAIPQQKIRIPIICSLDVRNGVGIPGNTAFIRNAVRDFYDTGLEHIGQCNVVQHIHHTDNCDTEHAENTKHYYFNCCFHDIYVLTQSTHATRRFFSAYLLTKNTSDTRSPSVTAST